MKIRNYKPGDEEQIEKLIKEVLLEIYNKTETTKEVENKILFLVAEEKGKIIGMIILQNENGIARIRRFYINKSFRYQGLGTKMIKQVEEFSKLKGFDRVILTVYAENCPAIKFYLGKGYSQFKVEGKMFYMEKNL